MTFQQPDPRFTQSKRSKANFTLALRVSLAFLAILWTIFIIDAAFGLRLGRFGLQPQSIPGLIGLITAPLFHASFSHMFSNSLPLFLSLTAVLYLYPNSSLRAIPIIWLGSGAFAWIIGRPSFHFGASGLVYGLLAYILISGIIRRDMRSVAASLLVWFLYGTMVWGVLPIRPNMSWEMHLGGALMGVMAAIIFRKWDRPPMVRYDWEDDDSVPDWYPDGDQSGKLDHSD